MRRLVLIVALALVSSSACVTLAAGPEFEVRLVRVFDNPEGKTEYVLVVGDVGFRSVKAFKGFVARLEPGTVLRWAPGCERFGDEPLLSQPRQLEAFQRFAAHHGVKFMLIPAG
jgi:hypothetical protein